MARKLLVFLVCVTLISLVVVYKYYHQTLAIHIQKLLQDSNTRFDIDIDVRPDNITHSERYNLDIDVKPKNIFGKQNDIDFKSTCIPWIIHQTGQDENLPNVYKVSLDILSQHFQEINFIKLAHMFVQFFVSPVHDYYLGQICMMI